MKESVTYPSPFAEQDIIQRIVEGENALFEILIRRYNPVLYKVARGYGFNHQDAEDLMQETYITAFTHLVKFEHRSTFKTWITRIMINKCIYKLTYGHYKREKYNVDISSENKAPMFQQNHTDTGKTVINKEFSKLLEHQLLELPVIYRSVFMLREIEGFSIAETSELLDISEVNVKVRLNRARTMLQKKLEQYYSSADIFEFNLIYCDDMVKNVFEKINSLTSK